MTDYFFNPTSSASNEGQPTELTAPTVGAAVRRLETFEVMTRRIAESKEHLQNAEKKFQETRLANLCQLEMPTPSANAPLVHLNEALQFLHQSREALHSFGSLIGDGKNRNEHFARCLVGIESQIKRIEKVTTKLTKSKSLIKHTSWVETLEKACSFLASSLQLTLGEAVDTAKEELKRWIDDAQRAKASRP